MQFVLLTMGLMMPETCWVNLLWINIYTCVICWFCLLLSTTPLIRINWDCRPPRYADKSGNWIFLWRCATFGIFNFGCYSLQYVLGSKPFDHSWFEVVEAITLYCTWSGNRQFQGKLVIFKNFAFMWPCIVVNYFSMKPTDALVSKFTLVQNSTCFG